MENSRDSAEVSACSTPFMLKSPSDSSNFDWGRFLLGSSSSSSSSSAVNFPVDERDESPSSSHRLAEKRRRDRINTHLTALRKLVPNSDKMDKAALLAAVIEQVKELKQQTKESPIFPNHPAEADEVTVNSTTIPHYGSDSEQDEDRGERFVLRASFCCEDRPEVLSEIIRVLKRLRLETIRADIICIGGRTRNNFIFTKKKEDGISDETDIDAAAIALKQSLSSVLSQITSSSSAPSIGRIRSKRQRWFMSSHYSL